MVLVVYKYRFTKLDMVTVGEFCFHFSRVLGSVKLGWEAKNILLRFIPPMCVSSAEKPKRSYVIIFYSIDRTLHAFWLVKEPCFIRV